MNKPFLDKVKHKKEAYRGIEATSVSLGGIEINSLSSQGAG